MVTGAGSAPVSGRSARTRNTRARVIWSRNQRRMLGLSPTIAREIASACDWRTGPAIGVPANQFGDGQLELFGGRNGICKSIGRHHGPVVVVVVVLVDPVSGLRGDSSWMR